MLDDKIRDTALSDDPTQIKGRLAPLESFIGNVDDVAGFIPGGSDLANFLRFYASILYFDTSVTPGNILINPYWGDLTQIPAEVMMIVIPAHDNIDGLNSISFRRAGQTDVTFPIKKRNITSGGYEDLVPGDFIRYSFCSMYLSDQGFFVVSSTGGLDALIAQVHEINTFLSAIRKAGTDYYFEQGTLFAPDIQVQRLVQSGTDMTQLTNLTVSKDLTVETGVVNFYNAEVVLPEPLRPNDAVTVEYLDQKLNTVMDSFKKISDKFIVGVEASPELDSRTQNAPIGTFYFKLK